MRLALWALVVSLSLHAVAIRAQPSFQEGVRLFDTAHFTAARSVFDSILKEDPTHGGAAFYLGRISYGQHDYERAIDWFKKAIQHDPSNSDYHLWLGRSYGREAQVANVLRKPFLARKARHQFETAVSLDPDNVKARWDLMEYYLDAPRFLGGSLEKATAQAREIQTRDPAEGEQAWKLVNRSRGH